ncbi:MAG TPA: hypothetical protein VER96_41985 [Polyangiaceae bacterium]|nr:hypothetical protein [Polyangiaceae bacterium]
MKSKGVWSLVACSALAPFGCAVDSPLWDVRLGEGKQAAPLEASIGGCDEDLRRPASEFTFGARTGLLFPGGPSELDRAAMVAAADCVDASMVRRMPEREVALNALSHSDYEVLPRLEAQAEEIANARATLDSLLGALYPHIDSVAKPGLDLLGTVDVALFDYARLLREEMGRPLHTRVARLQDNAACAGDLLSERMLVGYFRAATRAASGDRDAAAQAASSLWQFARQLSCLSDAQLFDLDAGLSSAWDRLEIRIAKGSGPTLTSAVLPFILQVRLLVLDATKHLGSNSPGYRWLVAQEDLRRRIRDEALLPLADHLWLYDRRSGAIAALHTQCDDGGSGRSCMSLSVLLDTLASPEAYGFGECSLLEMVEAGVRTLKGSPAYTCTPGVCGTPGDGRIADAQLGASFVDAFFRGGPFSLPRRKATSAFGVEVQELQASLCGKNGGGWGGKEGSAGMGASGMGPAGDALACVVGLKAQEAADLVPGVVCLGRYVQATSPLNQSFESMAAVNYAGVPEGCALSEEAQTEDDKKKEEEKKKKEAEEKAAKDEAKRKQVEEEVKKLAKQEAERLKTDQKARQGLKDAAAREGVTLTDADIDKAIQALENATVGSIPIDADGKTVFGTTGLDGKITIDVLGWVLAGVLSGDTGQRDGLLHEFVHSALSSYWNGRWNNEIVGNVGADAKLFKDIREVRDTSVSNSWRGGKGQRCAREGGGCSDRCNGLSVQIKEALSCLADAFDPPKTAPRPVDLVTDPVEPTGLGADRFAACLPGDATLKAVVAARACGAVLCANQDAGYTEGGCCQAGGLLSSTGMGDRNREVCQVARCEPGIGMSANVDTCGCGSPGAGTNNGGPIPPHDGGLPFPPY